MKFVCILTMSIFSFFNLFGQSDVMNEAPHVFYRGSKIVTYAVVDGKAVLDSIASKDKVEVNVAIEGKPALDFKVKLKKELINEPSIAKGTDKMLFVSDIEGEFTGFRALLITNKVIDEHYNWIYGNGKLIICGDLFDRGARVTEVLWLLYKLEQDAVKHGGYVHTILGNHDIMNLSGDLRYVHPRYKELATIMGLNYMELFANDTELGRWLRSKNIIEKIGDNLCAHAGIAPQINKLKMPVEVINEKCRPYLDKARYLKDIGIAEGAGVELFFTGETSLFWYRGYFVEPKSTLQEVDETLEFYKVKHIVVGHTITKENVGFYYGQKVIGLDVNQHASIHQAALFEKGKWYKVDEKGLKDELK